MLYLAIQTMTKLPQLTSEVQASKIEEIHITRFNSFLNFFLLISIKNSRLAYKILIILWVTVALSVSSIGVRKCPCFDVLVVIIVLIVIIERLTKVWILIKMTCMIGSKHWRKYREACVYWLIIKEVILLIGWQSFLFLPCSVGIFDYTFTNNVLRVFRISLALFGLRIAVRFALKHRRSGIFLVIISFLCILIFPLVSIEKPSHFLLLLCLSLAL
jgi:hypothetical protein